MKEAVSGQARRCVLIPATRRARHIAVIMSLVALAGCNPGGSSALLAVDDAFSLCDEAIRAAAAGIKNIEIPPKTARETVRVYSFVWRVGDGLKTLTAEGAETERVVTCRVNKESREVVHLEMDGEAVVLER